MYPPHNPAGGHFFIIAYLRAMQTPLSVFQQRITQFEAAIQVVNKKLDRIAFVRLLVFVAAAGIEVWSWYQNPWLWLPVLVAGLAGFIAVIKWDTVVNEEKAYLELKKKINEQEIARLEGKLEAFDEGNEFEDVLHPYASDLDLFGHHSLYQLINRASTRYGKETLAHWMKHTGNPSQIRSRQQAATALADNIDWRQEFQATGMQSKAPGDSLEDLDKWVKEEPQLSTQPIYSIIPLVLPVITLALTVLSLIPMIHWGIPLAAFAIHVLIIRRIGNYSKEVFFRIERRAPFLAAFGKLIQQMEILETSTPLTDGYKQRLAKDGPPAYKEIASLSKLLVRLELRLNGLPYYIMNYVFFWDMIWLVRLERWKARHKDHVLDWFRVIGEMEALASVSALRFARQDWQQPEILETEFCLEGESLGHPLIPGDVRITNPISLPVPGRIWLITGSNMSGKSTYLRTVGINVVLALMGAPVCADAFRISPMQVATSMRTQDSIEENTSSFYAELKRLKMVIERVERGEQVLFLLDEILKGTNSRDRHAGARALISQLQAGGGSGLVSTHDLELVDLEQTLKGAVKNYSFNCEVSSDGKLDFDYTLTDGVCRSMNATALMKTMGIRV